MGNGGGAILATRMPLHDTAAMTEWRRSWFGNPAAWYTAIGFGLLFLTVYVPWLTAERTARVERRAERIAALLAEVVADIDRQLEADDVPIALARLYLAAERTGEFTADLERVEPPLPGTLLTLRNKHYAFHLAASPPPAQYPIGRDTIPAYEVLAWPLTRHGPGHAAFFVPDNAPRAYTRNLGASFAGMDQPPPPGSCHAVPGLGREAQASYRSANDERWILY
jgi:hypothetical protein